MLVLWVSLELREQRGMYEATRVGSLNLEGSYAVVAVLVRSGDSLETLLFSVQLVK